MLELGGSDQWGNLTSGLDLIHKVRGVDVNVFTSPIITDAQGKKFGKSEGNAVWLDGTMLSPYKFYQFWFNRPDSEMENLLKVFTFLPKAEIERLVEESKTNPGAREAQRTLLGRLPAWFMVRKPPDRPSSRRCAVRPWRRSCGRDESTLEAALDGVKIDGEFAKAAVGDRVAEAGMKAGLFKSISEARKTIKAGGVYLNNARVKRRRAGFERK